MIENQPENIIIADSQYLIIQGLVSLIDADERYVLAGVAENQKDLYKLLEDTGKGLLIVDFANIDFEGVDDLKKIKERFPQISILVLSNSITKVEFSGLTRFGIRNIIYKMAEKDELFSAIGYALKGRKFYSDEILDLFLDQTETRYIDEDPRQLTASEMEIVKLIVGGMTTKEIASTRNISYHTVNTHRKNILRKLDVSNSSELIIRAIKSGWIDNIEYYI